MEFSVINFKKKNIISVYDLLVCQYTLSTCQQAFSFSHKIQYIFFITPCVQCGFTHASRAEIRIFTPRDIKFHTILMRKTFHRTRIVMYYFKMPCARLDFRSICYGPNDYDWRTLSPPCAGLRFTNSPSEGAELACVRKSRSPHTSIVIYYLKTPCARLKWVKIVLVIQMMFLITEMKFDWRRIPKFITWQIETIIRFNL